MRGMIHIYCGDGKGKTTCATGLAIRMAGAGKKVVFARFLKEDTSSELNILKKIPEITLCLCGRCYGFFWNMTPEEKKEAEETFRRYFKEVTDRAVSDRADMLVLDEIMAAYNHGLVDRGEVLDFLKARPEGLEVVLTGRDPAPALTELADYISRIDKVRHPFDKGVSARVGIEK